MTKFEGNQNNSGPFLNKLTPSTRKRLKRLKCESNRRTRQLIRCDILKYIVSSAAVFLGCHTTLLRDILKNGCRGDYRGYLLSLQSNGWKCNYRYYILDSLNKDVFDFIRALLFHFYMSRLSSLFSRIQHFDLLYQSLSDGLKNQTRWLICSG